jgi:predicted HD phosphohydrolase
MSIESIHRTRTVAPFESVDELMDRLHGLSGVCESVDALQHGLQCGHQLALRRPRDLELQVAGLVHDIGHDLVPDDDDLHGVHAADSVRWLLGDRVARLVELHVPAKRYLVTVDPRYTDLLSARSAQTVRQQGGAMTSGDLIAFEDTGCSADALILRMADDGAKVPGAVVPPLDAWRASLELVAAGVARTRET